MLLTKGPDAFEVNKQANTKMKFVSLKTTLSCIVCALLAFAASAQNEPTTSSGTQSGQPGMSGHSGASSMSGSKQSLRASKQLMNAAVKDQTGQNLGNIEDLIVNPQSGRVEFAVLSIGGKLHPVPFQLLTPSSTGATTGTMGTSQTTFTANVDRQKIEQSPSFERSQWPSISKDWTQQIYSHYGVQPEAMGSSGSSSQSGQEGGTSQETTPPTTPPTPSR